MYQLKAQIKKEAIVRNFNSPQNSSATISPIDFSSFYLFKGAGIPGQKRRKSSSGGSTQSPEQSVPTTAHGKGQIH